MQNDKVRQPIYFPTKKNQTDSKTKRNCIGKNYSETKEGTFECRCR